MGQSHVKRRDRDHPLRRYRAVVDRELRSVCLESALDPAESARREVIDTIVALANPYAYSGIDAVIPAERRDLLRVWLRLLLTQTFTGREEIERAARRLAPAPDDDFWPGLRHFGDPTSAEVRAAHISKHRRRGCRSARGGDARP